MTANRELAAKAKLLGHTDLAVIGGNGNTWLSTCICGWRSRRSYAIPGGAIQEAQAHLRYVVRHAESNGLEVPHSAPARL